jgi:hypothetical protein
MMKIFLFALVRDLEFAIDDRLVIEKKVKYVIHSSPRCSYPVAHILFLLRTAVWLPGLQ